MGLLPAPRTKNYCLLTGSCRQTKACPAGCLGSSRRQSHTPLCNAALSVQLREPLRVSLSLCVIYNLLTDPSSTQAGTHACTPACHASGSKACKPPHSRPGRQLACWAAGKHTVDVGAHTKHPGTTPKSHGCRPLPAMAQKRQPDAATLTNTATNQATSPCTTRADTAAARHWHVAQRGKDCDGPPQQ